jgi:hypothetical protein
MYACLALTYYELRKIEIRIRKTTFVFHKYLDLGQSNTIIVVINVSVGHMYLSKIIIVVICK